MDILFIHQNFPGQYKHLAPRLAQMGHRCVALTLRVKKPVTWKGVRVLPYTMPRRAGQQLHPWLVDLDTKLTRGHACFAAARGLREMGFRPALILAHPGWGESMFLRDVWPEARLGIYCELYHLAEYPHVGFDPEFPCPDPATEPLRIRIKNLNNHLHFPVATAGISPTRFQADTFPDTFRDRITVCHDGIDTALARPDAEARFALAEAGGNAGEDAHGGAKGGGSLSRADEVITFINRNLEPYRGYHVFMRALPQLLRARPAAQVVILGGDEVSYGAPPSAGRTWKQIFIDEVRGQIADADWARVHFCGRIPYERYLRLLQVSRVHVYLTYPFVLSWSLLEAMSSQAAIVASDTAPVREVIRDGETGRLVDFFDREALIARICELLEDAPQRHALGAAARRHIVAHYDLETICLPRQLDWVRGLLEAPPPAG
ncbi:MAG: glycosyltransferase [Roseovarius sp.]